MSPSEAYNSFGPSVCVYLQREKARAESRKQQTGWSASKGGHQAAGSCSEAPWETAGGTGEEMGGGSCCQILPGCHVDEGAGSLSRARPAETRPKDGSREADLNTRAAQPSEGVLTTGHIQAEASDWAGIQCKPCVSRRSLRTLPPL